MLVASLGSRSRGSTNSTGPGSRESLVGSSSCTTWTQRYRICFYETKPARIVRGHSIALLIVGSPQASWKRGRYSFIGSVPVADLNRATADQLCAYPKNCARSICLIKLNVGEVIFSNGNGIDRYCSSACLRPSGQYERILLASKSRSTTRRFGLRFFILP